MQELGGSARSAVSDPHKPYTNVGIVPVKVQVVMRKEELGTETT
jgi:hypothetical protein